MQEYKGLVDPAGNPIKLHRKSRTRPIMTRVRQTTDRDTFDPTFDFHSYKTAESQIDWKLTFLNEEKLCRANGNEIIKVLLSSSPDVSRAHSDMRMFINTGYELNVVPDDNLSEAVIEDAQRILDEAQEQMKLRKEPLSTKIDKLVSSMFLKGALYTECIFGGPNGELFLDIRILDPFRMAYREAENEEYGQYYELGEERNGQFVPIDSDLVQYIPVNPADNTPIGTPMISAAIFPVVMIMGMMKSSRQILETQAWPFTLWTIDGEKMLAGASDETSIADDVVKLTQDIIEDNTNAVKGQQFIYDAGVKAEIISGIQQGGFGAIETLQKILDQQIYRSLKQFPVVFGSTEGNALSTNAEQQLEAHSLFIDSLQSQMEGVLTTHFTQILRNAGNPATPSFRLRRTNALTDRIRAERFQIKVNSIVKLIDAGILSPQEGKDMIRDSEAIDNIGTVLAKELDPDAERNMRGSNNAQEQISEGREQEEEEDGQEDGTENGS